MGFEEQIKAHLLGDVQAAWRAGDVENLSFMIGDLTSFLGYLIACGTLGERDEARELFRDVTAQLEGEVDDWAQQMRDANGAGPSNVIRPAAFRRPIALPTFTLEEDDARTL